MISGARIGEPIWLRRLVARGGSRALTAFVVPDAAIARAHCLDLAAAGLMVVPSPRHANVLIVVGELPEGLEQPTAVAYAQMPRPRAILAIGAARVAALPAPDVTVALDQAALGAGIADLRRLFAADAWAADAVTFAIEIDAPHSAMGHGGHDHHMMHHGGHGEMPMNGHGQHDAMAQEDAPSEPHDMPTDHAMHHHADREMAHETPMTHGDHAAEAVQATDDPHGAMQHEMHGGMATDQGGHGAMAMPDDHRMAPHPHHDPHMAMRHDMHGDDMPAAMASPTEHEGDHGTTVPMDASDHQHHDPAMEHDMSHGGMDMSGGFMSMVAMTQGLPRSRDGLPMEWAETPFGPLFPSLPGGLALMLTLDGDTVAQAKVPSGALHRGLAATWPGPTIGFPDRLALLDLQTPVAYRVLASRALEGAAAFTIDEAVARQRVGALERERAVSHLSWLADFAALLGDRWLAERAGELQFALMHATDDLGLSRVGQEIVAFVRRVPRLPLLKWRLDGIGYDASHAAERMGGPFARACGMIEIEAVDARRDDPAYRALGFVPVRHDGNDAWARLAVRLDELTQSIGLIRAVGTTTLPAPPALNVDSGTGTATVETPRGPATLHVILRDGQVTGVHLDTPSARLVDLIPHMAEGCELADALVAIASLDLSPWEVDQ